MAFGDAITFDELPMMQRTIRLDCLRRDKRLEGEGVSSPFFNGEDGTNMSTVNQCQTVRRRTLVVEFQSVPEVRWHLSIFSVYSSEYVMFLQ